MTETSSPAERPTDLATLHDMMVSGPRWEKLEAINTAALMHGAAAPLVPLIATFLTSTEYVPCTQQKYDFSGHAPLANEAMRAIESIGVAPDAQVLRALLLDPQVLEFPEASYDQGAYIGDYGCEFVAPAGLAARLVPVMGQAGFVLLPELFQAACSLEDEIGKPARRAFQEMTKLLPEASAQSRRALADVAERMAFMPDALEPKSHRGFDLRDLAALLKKKLAALP